MAVWYKGAQIFASYLKNKEFWQKHGKIWPKLAFLVVLGEKFAYMARRLFTFGQFYAFKKPLQSNNFVDVDSSLPPFLIMLKTELLVQEGLP